MIKTFTKILEPGVLATLAAPDYGKDLTIMTMLVNGGEEGGSFTLSIDDYQEKYTIGAENTVIFDHKIMLTSGQSLSALSEVGGIKFYISAVESLTKENL